MEENAEVIADDKNNMKFSNNDEIIYLDKRATRSHQEKKTSDVEHNELRGEQKSHIIAVHEREAK